MPVTFQRLPDEPIIVVTCTGELNAAGMREIFAQTMALMRQDEDLIYRVVDYRAVTTAFEDVLRAAQAASGGDVPGSTLDARIRPVMVGGAEWLATAQRAFDQAPFGRVQIPMFASVDEAVHAIRNRIATTKE